MSERADILNQLDDCTVVLPTEELKVLLAVAQGMLKGGKQYGPMRLGNDPRDMVQEALEEVRDALVYIGAKLVQLQS